MYANVNTFYPNNIYLNIDFQKVKNKLEKEQGYIYNDYKTVFVIQSPEFMITLNNLGKIQVFDNLNNKSIIYKKIEDIKKIFKSQIEEFEVNIQKD